ncbi:S41 family peptidase, partial [Candidatus Omnitrophota bacterium]
MKYKSHGTFFVVILIFTICFSVNAPSEQTLNTMELLEAENLILEEIREAFVDSVDNAELLTGAIDGIIKKLDPHSSFLKPERAKDFNEKLRGSFQGIGITFAIINDKITIIEAVEGGPSEAVGITSRDKIVKINGNNAVGINEDSVKVQLRGEKGTKVNVHIERPDEEKLLKFTIVRDEIKQNSVSHSYMIDETTGY